MNPFVLRFYQDAADIEGIKDPFREVVFFDHQSSLNWKEIEAMAPQFPKPWFELFQLSHMDRIDFLRANWEKTLPYQPKLFSFIDTFFSKIEDVVVVLVKNFSNDPYRVEMVYTLKSNEKLFFRGGPPASFEDIHQLNAHFDYLLPSDFLAFLQIHNGFSKGADQGVLPIEKILKRTYEIQKIAASLLEKREKKVELFNPEALIVFYQSYSEEFFHCFYTEWFPKNEAGNVYYSLFENHISDIKEGSRDLAFFTFFDWLTFYMEDIEAT